MIRKIHRFEKQASWKTIYLLMVVNGDILGSLLEAKPIWTLTSFEEAIKICYKTIGNYLKNMGKVTKLDILVPHHLEVQQKQQRFKICIF